MRRTALELVALSFLALFQELTLIRWLPGQVRVLAYFPNLILISAFLGLGIGCLRARAPQSFWMWPLSLLGLVATAAGLSGIVFTQKEASEHLFLLYYDLPRDARVVSDLRPPIIGFFALVAVTFVPLGQAIARRLQLFREQATSLRGYCLDIAGSLAGVGAFTLFGASGAFPVVWFLVLLAVGIWFFAGRLRLVAFLIAAALVLVVVRQAERSELYSPYYAMRTTPAPAPESFVLLTNGSLHQVAFDPRGSGALPEYFAKARAGYEKPYAMLSAPPKRALVLGAGTGNDVAMLLDRGAGSVDAVEIDAAILDYGRRMHPAKPYASPKVRVFSTDARSFLESSKERYDLIVFGTLDSLTRLSALSNVRLDNFVYTLDCLSAAREHLTKTGGVVLFFSVGTEYIDARLLGMLTRTFDQVPFVVSGHFSLFNRIFMAGPAFESFGGPDRRDAAERLSRGGLAGVELPTDDWPFLYLQSRSLSGFYVSLMLALAAIAVGAIYAASPEMRSAIGRGGGADWEMFLFGLAFLLLETSSVTRMNLIWGGTWLTSAVVFGAILFTVLLATIVTQIRPLRYTIAFAALAVALVCEWGVPVHRLLAVDVPLRLALSVAFVGLPIFFASTCFALVFVERADADVAFGWNLLGAVFGGLLELMSMVLGMKALLLVALLAYLSALWIALRSGRSYAPSHGDA